MLQANNCIKYFLKIKEIQKYLQIALRNYTHNLNVKSSD